MMYQVTRKEITTGKIFITECNQDQVNNITKYPSSLYTLESIESIEPIQENTIIETKLPEVIIESEKKKAGRPASVNTVKELNSIIKTGKRELKNYINEGYDRTFIYNWYELIKKDCKKYSESNKTTQQIYYNFLLWWNKYDKQLFPEFHI